MVTKDIKTAKSTQEIWNLGFDTTYNLPVVEGLVYNPTTCEIDRMVQPATSTAQDTQTTLLQGIAGFTITGYDYIVLTYVAAGNGVGEIETAIFKTGGSAGTTIATLTLAYDVNNNLSTVTKT